MKKKKHTVAQETSMSLGPFLLVERSHPRAIVVVVVVGAMWWVVAVVVLVNT